jgi:hypothetical protein
MMSLAAVIFLFIPETTSFIDEVEVGRGAKHEQIQHPKHYPKSFFLSRFCRFANFFTLDSASPSPTR